MNYKKHYDLLMEKSKNRVLEGYVERHHIIPRCLGGSDDSENLAMLTPEEHFLAHQLLVKIYPKSSPLIKAALLMTTHNTPRRVNNKLFGWLRRRASVVHSQWLKENGHPRGMLGKKHDLDNIDNITSGLKKAATEKRIEIYTYNLDGTFCKKYESIIACAVDLGTNPSNVKYTADGKFSHCKNKILRYEYSDTVQPYTKPKVIKQPRTPEHSRNISIAKKGKKVNRSSVMVCCIICKKETTTNAFPRFHKHEKENKCQNSNTI
jgi:hypothetical protein